MHTYIRTTTTGASYGGWEHGTRDHIYIYVYIYILYTIYNIYIIDTLYIYIYCIYYIYISIFYRGPISQLIGFLFAIVKSIN